MVLFFFLLGYAMEGGSSFDFMKPLVEHNVLCYIPADATMAHVESYTGPQGIQGIIAFVLQQPVDFLVLGGKKLLSFWGVVRPHFSTLHNAVLMAYFYPVYLMAVAGCLLVRTSQPGFWLFAVGTCVVFSLSVVFTCDDWTSRFIMPIVPVVLLMAGLGAQATRRRFRKSRTA